MDDLAVACDPVEAIDVRGVELGLRRPSVRPARDRVAPAVVGVDDVEASLRGDDVAAGVADDQVGGWAAEEAVGARASFEDVLAVAAHERVVPQPALRANVCQVAP